MADNNRICGAKSRRTGTPCQRRPAAGRARCRLHGGATPIGPASANWKHGRRSRWAAVTPGALADRLARAEADEELLSLRSDVALLNARIEELLTELPAGASGEQWGSAAHRFADLRKAINGGDTAATLAALTDLGSILQSGQRQARIWDEVGLVLERKRKLVESERRAVAEADGLVPVAAALLVVLKFRDKVVARLAEAAADGLTPEQTILRIDAEYALIAHQPDRVAADAKCR